MYSTGAKLFICVLLIVFAGCLGWFVDVFDYSRVRCSHTTHQSSRQHFQASDEINLIELVWFVWDNKITIITSALMCFAAVFGYILQHPKNYTSNTLSFLPARSK